MGPDRKWAQLATALPIRLVQDELNSLYRCPILFICDYNSRGPGFDFCYDWKQLKGQKTFLYRYKSILFPPENYDPTSLDPLYKITTLIFLCL